MSKNTILIELRKSKRNIILTSKGHFLIIQKRNPTLMYIIFSDFKHKKSLNLSYIVFVFENIQFLSPFPFLAFFFLFLLLVRLGRELRGRHVDGREACNFHGEKEGRNQQEHDVEDRNEVRFDLTLVHLLLSFSHGPSPSVKDDWKGSPTTTAAPAESSPTSMSVSNAISSNLPSPWL